MWGRGEAAIGAAWTWPRPVHRDRRVHGVFTGAAPVAHGGAISWPDIRFTLGRRSEMTRSSVKGRMPRVLGSAALALALAAGMAGGAASVGGGGAGRGGRLGGPRRPTP